MRGERVVFGVAALAGWVASSAIAEGQPQRAAVDALPVVPLKEWAAGAVVKRPREAEIRRRLGTTVSVAFEDVLLTDAIDELAKRGGFSAVLDETAMRAVGYDSKTSRVSGTYRGVSVRQALHVLLEPNSLGWLVRHEKLVVTSAAACRAHFETRLYPAGRILRAMGGDPQFGLSRADAKPETSFGQFQGAGPPAVSELPQANPAQELMDLIQQETAGPWEEFEGEGGTISLLKGANVLIVKQTQAVHEEVNALLAALRAAIESKRDGSVVAVRPPGYPVAEDRRIRRALLTRIDVDFKQTPLSRAFPEVARKLGVRYALDDAALREDLLDPHRSRCTFKSSGASAESVLALLLAPHKLTVVCEYGFLKLTTKERAAPTRYAMLYNLRELLHSEEIDAQKLVGAIEQDTTGPWENVHGVGGTISLPRRLGVMVVRQNERVHREVAVLLLDLRARLKDADGPQQDALAKVVVRFYPIGEQDRARQLREAIEAFVEPQSWRSDKPNGPAIRVVNGTLVVRHSVQTHRRIGEFLKRLDAAESAGDSPRRVRSGIAAHE